MKAIASAAIFTAISAFFLTSCDSEYRSVSLPHTEYINHFPLDTLVNGEPSVYQELIGVKSIEIIDSLMIFDIDGNEYFWEIRNMLNPTISKYLLKKGEGPDEYLSAPTSLTKINFSDSLSFSAWDYTRQVLLLGKTWVADDGCPEVSLLKKEYKQLKDAKYVLPLNDSTLYVCLHDFNNGGFKRGLFKSGRFTSLKNMGTFEADFSDLNPSNISFIPTLNQEGTNVAEAMIRLNQINLYSLTDTLLRTTLTTSDKLDNINKVENMNSKDIIRRYTDVKSYDNLFIALYQGVSRKDFSEGECMSEFQVYDWNGKPVCRIKTDKCISSFAVDKNGKLLGLDINSESETIFSWDLPEILSHSSYGSNQSLN